MARTSIVRVTPTITAGSYTTGKALGGLLTFTNLFSGMGATIINACISDKANQKIAVDLLLFDQSITATADAATLAISTSDQLKAIGHISFVAGDYITVGTGAIATKGNLWLAARTAVDNNIYGQLVIRGSATYVSTSDIQVSLVSQDDRGLS